MDAFLAFLLVTIPVGLVLGLPPLKVLGDALGSATAAGVMLPIVQPPPNLLVLSIGAGRLFLLHLNDGGFWLSVKDTLRSWSVMECILSVVGMLGVLALDWGLRVTG